ncbi:YybH family protein [Streptacidiphilus albus]|uniref:YybH family protein n=1 Tax=Streptacidiphilus albus TaxID=105425 RepID=UPI00054BAA41|nr:SgcJ/EcaC family oxidoreductase [Streptacidiphilus albus]
MSSQEPVNSRIDDPARLPFAYADALNAGDADAVLALFHQDATMRTFNGEVLADQEALLAEAVRTIAAQAHLTNKPRSTLIGGGTALSIVDWDLEATLPDGTRISPTGTTMAVARRSADGSWRFAVLNCQGAVGSPGWQTTESPAGGR